MTRDTAKYRPLQRKKNKPHSLKWLARTHLELNIQSGEHEPVSILISTNSKKKNTHTFLILIIFVLKGC